MTVAEIKEQISRLTPDELCEVAAFVSQVEDDAWDKQIYDDIKAGRFAKFDREVEEAVVNNELYPWPGKIASK
jgi:ABC-type cobalamin/Fe3+-siderophores transport system ATPase subunit